jgi:peroxiredoxin
MDGKPTLLMFFSAGCEHNQGGIKDLNRLQGLFGGRVRVAGMTNLDAHQTKELAKKYSAKFPILSDRMASTIGAFGGKAGLDNALILSNGQIAHLWSGYDRTTLKQVEILLARNHGPHLNLDFTSFPKDREAGCAIGMTM